MSIAKVIAFVAVFLMMMSSNGELPVGCRCSNPASQCYFRCNTRGCSVGDARECQSYYAFTYGNFSDATEDHFILYRGRNCPGNAFKPWPGNSYYTAGVWFQDYNYTDCASFGNNAREHNGSITQYVAEATNCCNYCCGIH